MFGCLVYPSSWDGGTARTALLVHAGIRLGGKVAFHFEPVMNANYRLVAPPPTRWTAIGGYPRVASYNMLGDQLHNSNPVKHEWVYIRRLYTRVQTIVMFREARQQHVRLIKNRKIMEQKIVVLEEKCENMMMLKVVRCTMHC